MHETQLARRILDVVLGSLEEQGGTRVVGIRGWVAETETLSPESLDFHFRAHAAGTAAADARLDLECRHVAARCGGCAHEYLPEHHVTLCPECGGTEATLLGETGLGIETIEVR